MKCQICDKESNLFADWYEFYQTKNYLVSSHKNNAQISSSSSGYFVCFCSFSKLSSRSISVDTTNPSTNLLTEDILFSECSNSENGGSLFFQTKGQCVQNKICSYKSKVISNVNGVFCYVHVSEQDPFQNKILCSSIIESGDGNGLGYGNIYTQQGAVNLTSDNVSFANICRYPTISMNTVNANSVFKFTTFASNKLTDTSTYSIFNLYGASASIQLEIISCNILNNIGNNHIIYSGSLNTLVSKSNFVNNVHPSASFSGTVTLSECYIDNYKGGATIIKSFPKSTMLILSHLSTYKCQAVNPLHFNNPSRIILHFIQHNSYVYQVIFIF